MHIDDFSKTYSAARARTPTEVQAGMIVDLQATLALADEKTFFLMSENARLREALKQVESWSGFPETGVFWDPPHSHEPMSYGACYGSTGERDFMRGVARAALAATKEGSK